MSGTLYAVLGLVIGACFALISTIGGFSALGDNPDAPAWLGAVFGVGAIIALPIFYGLLGLIMGAFMAWLYNVVSGMVGGVVIDVQ
jgi:hypothetical protein